MHKYLGVFLALAIMVCSANASIIVRSYNSQPVKIEELDGYDILTIEGMLTYGDPGEPALPIYAHTLLLPPGESIKSVSFLDQKWELLDIQTLPRPGSEILPISSEKTPYFIENSEIYQSTQTYPENIIHDIQTGYLRGHAIGSFLMTVIRWNPSTGQTEQLVQATLEIETENTQQAQDALRLLRTGKRTNHMLENVTSDLEFAGLYQQGTNYELDEVVPSLLIICHEAHLEAWEEYAAYKRNRGMETIVVTTNDIYQEYEGIDNAQKVQNAIFMNYLTNSIEHVLLGGDINYVPYRRLYAVANNEGDHLPSDLYYAGLDVSWNADGDEYWGESNEDDLLQEVTVGRASITSLDMARSWINKQISYQSEPVVEELTQAMMVGEDLGWTCWGGEYKDEVRYGSNHYGYVTEGFPDQFNVTDLYDMNNVWDIPTLFDRLSSGVHLVNHLGHANTGYALKASNNDITNFNLTNDGINHSYYLIYTQGCYCGNFEEESIMERWTTIDNGAFATIANSRYGWGSGGDTNGPSQRYDREFFDAIFDEEIYKVGDANRDSKHDNMAYINQNCMRWCYYELNLFGDPTIDLYTDIPQNEEPQVSDVYVLGSPGIEVETGGIAGIEVAVSRDGELLACEETDANGYALVPLDLAEMGELHITVSGHNYIEYERDIMAISPAGGYPVVEEVLINDTAAGNGNNRADFCENLQLDFQVRNFGQADINLLQFYASTESPWISIDTTMLEETQLSPDEAITFSILAEIDQGVVDQSEATINVRMYGDTCLVSSEYTMILHAPVMAVESFSVDDSEFGNSNYHIDPGETVTLTIDLSNSGTADLNGTTLVSISNDPVISEITNPQENFDFQYGMNNTLENVLTLTIPEDIESPCRSYLLFEISREDGYTFNKFLTLEIGGFFENVEGGDLGLDHYAFEGDDQWHISSERNYSTGGQNAWKIGTENGEYANDMDACLELPPLDRTHDIVLTFYHWMDAEESIEHPGECYDGGVVELSADQEIWHALPLQSYTHTTRGEGPLGTNQRVFSGEFEWQQETINIGQGDGFAYLRFRFGSDRGLAGEGWYIDDIKVFIGESRDPVVGLVGEYADGIVNLSWRTPSAEVDEDIELLGFNVYREGEIIAEQVVACEYEDHLSGFPVDTYRYFVTAIYNNGTSNPCEPVAIEFDGWAVDENNILPDQWSVGRAYPNPFNPTVTVPFNVPNTGAVSFSVYNILGQKVFAKQQVYSTGQHRFIFNGSDLVSGVYFLNVSFNNLSDTQKILLVK